MPHVTRTVGRPSRQIIESVAKFTPATLHEAQGRRGALASRIKPIYSGMTVCGPAVTAQCHPGDNIMLQLAINVAQPGDVLVVATGESSEQGAFGEVLTTWCLARQIAGLVTDGGVRDGRAIARKGFPVFCPGLCIKGTVKETLGTVNQPIVIGGITVRPGDIICGDDDGVVVVRPEEAAQAVAASLDREEKEAQLMEALQNGEDLLHLVGMDKVAAAKGCTYDEQVSAPA